MAATASSEAQAPTRTILVAAAARAFATHGYRAATIQMIAQEAGFTPPTVYAHFGSKLGLFEALVEELREDLFSVLGRSMPAGLSLGQSLELRVRDVLELAERRRDIFHLFIVRPFDLPDLGASNEEHTLLAAHWEHVFAQHAAELGDRTPRECALVMEGVMYAWVKRWVASDEERISSETRRLVDLMLNGLLQPAP